MISILMATYQGETFLAEQMESLFRQTVQDFHLYVRDDGSTDATLSLLKTYQQRYPGRITILKNLGDKIGPWQNYMSLITQIKDDYIMLCDQDDIWKADKVEKSLHFIKQQEALYGEDEPIIIHTDAVIIQQNGEVLSPSHQKLKRTSFERYDLRHLLVQNTITGCTVMYNRALGQLVCEVPDFMVMHDWWLALVASMFGKIFMLQDCTVYYRWHKNNSAATQNLGNVELGLFKALLLSGKKVHKVFLDTFCQIKHFLDIYEDQMTIHQKMICRTYAGMEHCIKPLKWYYVFRFGFWKSGFFRKIVQLVYI